MWRKTRSKNADSTCIGVDANRNFDISWGKVSPIPLSAGSKPPVTIQLAVLKQPNVPYGHSLGVICVYVTVHGIWPETKAFLGR